MYHFGLVQPVDCLGQRIVVGIPNAPNGRFNACLGQALGVADTDVLRPAGALLLVKLTHNDAGLSDLAVALTNQCVDFPCVAPREEASLPAGANFNGLSCQNQLSSSAPRTCSANIVPSQGPNCRKRYCAEEH